MNDSHDPELGCGLLLIAAIVVLAVVAVFVSWSWGKLA